MAKKRRTELDIDSEFLAEKPEEAPPPPAAEPPPPERPVKEKHPKKKINKVKLLIVVASGIAAITLTVALVWLAASIFTSVSKHKPAPTPPPPPKQEATPAPAVSLVYSLQPFFIPLKEKGPTESKLVKVQFELEMVSPETQRDMDRNIILVRENIYFMLQNKGRADFMDKEKLAKLAVDVAIAVNRSLQSGGVSRVFITDILIN
jgi:flagellar basal body-associated protein FliL